MLGGREFDLYYTGTHLHMVVLRAHGASYWVVNTLARRRFRTRRCSRSRRVSSRSQRQVGFSRHGEGGHLRRRLGRPRHRRLLRRVGPRGRGARRRAGEDRGAARAARSRSTRHEVPELLERNRERLTFTLDVGDVADCEFLFVCVDTPPTYSGDADLSRVWTRRRRAAGVRRGAPILVMKSTVPVGTGEKIRVGLDARGLEHVGYASNPEFLAEGTPCATSWHPDRVVVGAFEAADARRRRGAVRRHSTRRSCAADVNSAEMIKLAANAFLMTRISFINEIANVCEATGADVVEVAEGVGLDQRLGPHFLRAGIGYGGSCFPKDSLALKQLASNSGYHFQLLSAVIEVNELQKRRVIGKLEATPRLAPRQEGRAARARVQAEHRRHARGAFDRARRRGSSPRAPRCAAGIRSPTASAAARRRDRRLGRRGGARAPTRR